MPLSSLLSNQIVPVHSWIQLVVDRILQHGDSMYLHALSNKLVPDRGTLNINNLPIVQGKVPLWFYC